ncbi:unnamed protein product [Coffea canephora]|uniref:Uncharacterized protein n=1 Tax=Coffea canephora TaxID=49390 RepID=A0A068U6Z7_COFCA|nr:unnamed protein product [Coffea canephora]
MRLCALNLLRIPMLMLVFLALYGLFLANRWNFQMPEILEGSILIMSKAGAGLAMFN